MTGAMLELPTLSTYLAGVLKPALVGTPMAGKVYRGSLAPENVAPPFLLYFLQVGIDHYTLPAHWHTTEVTYFIKGVALAGQYQSVLLPVMIAVSAALAALMGQDGTQGAYTMTLLGSDDPREYEETVPGGQVLVNLGRAWTWRVYLH